MPDPHPLDDPVADIYDGFVHRLGEPDIDEEIARDFAWRLDSVRVERRAGDRLASVLPFLASFIVPHTRRQSVRMVLFWVLIGSLVLLASSASRTLGSLGIACGVTVLLVSILIGAIVYLSGIDLLMTREEPGLCQGCRYSLESLPPALDPELTLGRSIGPARCPECGLRWPMVPRTMLH